MIPLLRTLFQKKVARLHQRRAYRPTLETLERRTCPALVAPSITSCIAVSPNEVSLAWTDMPDETGYRVLHWTGVEAVEVAAVNADVTTLNVTGAKPGWKEWYTIEAVYANGSAQSAWQSITMPVDPITVPSQLSASAVTSKSFTLNWADSQGETGYRVYLWDGQQPKLLATVNADVTSHAVTGLAAAKGHYVYVEAFNASTAVPSAWLTVTTLAEPISAAKNLTATALSTTSVRLNWTDATGETGYRIYQWDGVRSVIVGTATANATTATISKLAAGKTYWFYVQAYNATNSANSAWHAVSTLAGPALPAPTGLTARKISSTRVQLDWKAAPQAGGYNIYLWNGAIWRLVTSVSGTATRTTMSGFASGRTYWFYIQAFGNSGNPPANSAVTFLNF